jgi:hypothetical protein
MKRPIVAMILAVITVVMCCAFTTAGAHGNEKIVEPEVIVEYVTRTVEVEVDKSFKIDKIEKLTVDGNTIFYLKLKNNPAYQTAVSDKVFSVQLNVNAEIPFLASCDKIKIKYEENHGLYVISELEIIKE